ncbi:MAG: NAD(P)-dependent oxidoreductase [Chloroflexota bacterium]
MRVGWIGLGKMGRPMVENLVRKGFDVVAQNRSQDKVDILVAMGATKGGTLAEMARGGLDTFHTCLPNDATVEEVIGGRYGILSSAPAGLVVVDHSTIHPDLARQLARQASARGVRFLDAPVSGSGSVAERGELTIMVGGDAIPFQQALPALEAMGRTVRHMGPSGSGATTKVVNNMLMGTNLAVAFEGLLLGSRLGIDPQALFEVIRTASGNSRAWERNAPRAISHQFGQDGEASLLDKDLNVAAKLAEAAGVEMPVFQTALALWDRVNGTPLRTEDPSHAVTLLEEDAGFRIGG